MNLPGQRQREVQNAIDLRMKIAQVPQGAKRVNGPDRPVPGVRPALFLVKPGTTAADLKTDKEARRLARAEALKTKHQAQVLMMPSQISKRDTQLTLGIAAAFGPLAWLLDLGLHWMGLL